MNEVMKKEEQRESCELKNESRNFCCDPGKPCYEILPAMEACDDENGVEITLEVPGANAESVHINVEDGVMNICAASRLMRSGMGIVYKRAFRLSDAVDVEGICAATKDGLLKITLPKAEKARVHHIPVK